jgi:thymidine kinase
MKYLIYSKDINLFEKYKDVKKAVINCRHDGNRVIYDGNQIDIGGNDKYIGLYYGCWINGRLK